MLQVAAQELFCRQRHGLPLPGIRVLVAEGDSAVLQGEYAVVGDGDSVNVSAKVAQHLFCPVEGWFAEDYPFLVPDFLREDFMGERLVSHLHEPAAKASGQGLHRHQKLLAGFFPLTVFIESPGRHQHMHMGVVLQGSGPGMEDSEDAELAANELRVEADGGEGFHRCLDQDVVEEFLTLADNVSQFRGDGEDEVEVAHRQQLCFSLL